MTPHYVVDEPWAKVPLSLVGAPGITLSDVHLYVYLDGRAGRRGWWYGSQREIGEATGITYRTVQRSVAALVTAGYIAVERLGADHLTVNRYVILARTVTIEADRHATDGASVAANGVTDAPLTDTLTSIDLTDQEPQKEEGLITDRRRIFQRMTGRRH